MQKNALLPIHPLLRERYSPYVFSNEPISKEDCDLLFEAARWAPSSYNRQPWFYYYGTKDTTGFEKLSETLAEGNSWAKKVPLLILGCYIDSDDHGRNVYGQYDLGQATFSLVIQAHAMSLYAHQMNGFDKKKASTLLQLPEKHIPHVMIAVGKINNTDQDQTTRTRKEILAKMVE